MMEPVGVEEAGGPVAVAGWGSQVQAGLAGAMVTASARVLWPAAASHKAQKARLGAVLGFGVAVLGGLLQGALCAGTPYCAE